MFNLKRKGYGAIPHSPKGKGFLAENLMNIGYIDIILYFTIIVGIVV